jgi:hypothetical protein
MKRAIQALIRRMVAHPQIWRFLDRVVLPPARYADWMRQKIAAPPAASHEEIVRPLFQSETVLHGPFKGMVYRNTQFCCSAIAPKLLGSYEREVQPWIEEMLAKSYDGIVDVGCAEGYYAVGFAWRKPGTPVYAYDISEQARAQCRALAESNAVSGRVDIRSFCDSAELGRLVAGRRFLVIADCEGYEKTLFAPSNRPQLARSDIFIEVHDFMDITILPYLRELFAGTHEIRERESIDDVRKLDRYDYPELAGLSLHDRYRQIAEWRQRIMVWMYLTPKARA